MGVYDTRKIIEELRDILEANTDIAKVSVGPVTPLAAEESSAAVYIALEEVALSAERMSRTSDGYDRHLLINLYCNYHNPSDPLGVLDFADSIERSVLKDGQIWTYIIDRDLVAIDFDNQASAPKRSFTMLFDFSFRVKC